MHYLNILSIVKMLPMLYSDIISKDDRYLDTAIRRVLKKCRSLYKKTGGTFQFFISSRM